MALFSQKTRISFHRIYQKGSAPETASILLMLPLISTNYDLSSQVAQNTVRLIIHTRSVVSI